MLLHNLCKGVGELPPLPNQKGKGRPRMPLCDAIVCDVFKVYSTVSAGRFVSDLCDNHRFLGFDFRKRAVQFSCNGLPSSVHFYILWLTR